MNILKNQKKKTKMKTLKMQRPLGKRVVNFANKRKPNKAEYDCETRNKTVSQLYAELQKEKEDHEPYPKFIIRDRESRDSRKILKRRCENAANEEILLKKEQLGSETPRAPSYPM